MRAARNPHAKQSRVRMGDRPSRLATIHNANVLTNCTITEVGPSSMRVIISGNTRLSAVPSTAPPNRDSARRRLAPSRPAAEGDGECDTIDQQCHRVVEQALALDDHHDTVRWAQRTKDRRGGGGVRRGDDCAEYHRDGPGHVRPQPPRGAGDGSDGQYNRHHRAAGDRQPVVPQVARRGVVGGVQQARRHEQGQHQIGRECQRRRSGKHREHRPGDGEEGGVGRPKPTGDRGKQRANDQQGDGDFEESHAVSLDTRTSRLRPVPSPLV